VTIEHNAFRERIVLDPIGLVENHEQSLDGLRYAKTAWRIDADDSCHEEVGYWLWDAQARQVMLSFIVPRGVMVLAGGTVEPDAKSMKLSATVGSEVFGICSGPFLDEEFKTVRCDIELRVNDDGSIWHAQNTQLQIKGQSDIFAHTDENTLRKVGQTRVSASTARSPPPLRVRTCPSGCGNFDQVFPKQLYFDFRGRSVRFLALQEIK
jgi:hypothetical protein